MYFPEKFGTREQKMERESKKIERKSIEVNSVILFLVDFAAVV